MAVTVAHFIFFPLPQLLQSKQFKGSFWRWAGRKWKILYSFCSQGETKALAHDDP